MTEKQYAVNVADLSRLVLEPFSVPLMLLNPVLSKQIVQAEPKRFDGDAAILDCEPERAEAIVELIRRKIPKHQLRIYYGAGKTWRRV